MLMENMYFLLAVLFLPMIDPIIVVKMYQSAVYQPLSPCAFIGNTTWQTDASIQSCIWECEYESCCQTAIYFDEIRTCSMYNELCQSGRIQSSGMFQRVSSVPGKNQGTSISAEMGERFVFLSTYDELFYHCESSHPIPRC